MARRKIADTKARARVITVPRIKDSADFHFIAALWARVHEAGRDDFVQFDFSRCPVATPPLIVSLAGMTTQLAKNGVPSFFVNMHPAMKALMSGLGYPIAVNLLPSQCPQNTVRLRHDWKEDRDGIIEYLSSELLGKSGIQMSSMLANAVLGQLWEAYANAFEHSKSLLGVITYGEHGVAQSMSEIAIADFGIGIPTKIRESKKAFDSAAAAMKWAFERGNTTEVDAGIPRGMGLNLLKNFVKKNNGKLEVFSEHGKVTVTAEAETYEETAFAIPGVLFQLRMVCDDRRYILSTEVGPPAKLF